MRQTHPEQTFCSMVEGISYGGGISSVRWEIFSTDVSHHQYGGGASSVVQWRACMVVQYGPVTLSVWRGYAVHGYENCSRGSWWLYLSGTRSSIEHLVGRPTGLQ